MSEPGRYAVISDPAGAVAALFEPDLVRGQGLHFAWHRVPNSLAPRSPTRYTVAFVLN